MDKWEEDDLIAENKSNKLSIIKGTTDEIDDLDSNEVSAGMLLFDETKGLLVLNTGTSDSPTYAELNAYDIATVRISPEDTIPDNWKLCDGSAISRTAYDDLYDIIGTVYGAGDGSTTFNLPDISDDRFIRAVDSNDDRNDKGGVTTVTLTVAQIPSHRHSLSDYSDGRGQDAAGSHVGPGSSTSGSSGGGQAHNNLPKYVNMKYIMRVK